MFAHVQDKKITILIINERLIWNGSFEWGWITPCLCPSLAASLAFSAARRGRGFPEKSANLRTGSQTATDARRSAPTKKTPPATDVGLAPRAHPADGGGGLVRSRLFSVTLARWRQEDNNRSFFGRRRLVARRHTNTNPLGEPIEETFTITCNDYPRRIFFPSRRSPPRSSSLNRRDVVSCTIARSTPVATAGIRLFHVTRNQMQMSLSSKGNPK